MILKDWQKEHYTVISDFLRHLNITTSDFVLKGGTSLMMCYNLDRFSEDVDLDAQRSNKNIERIVDEFCKKYNYSYNVNKDTDTVKRFMIHYTDKYNKPLKVEISYRKKDGHILENVVYLELIRRGFEVFVGKLGELEIDFVAIDNKKTVYFQVAATVRDETTLQRELAPLEKINDHYPKIILTLDDDPEADYNGIRRLNALEWLIGNVE